ncbi:MAG TPA: hypothetical protein G4N98_06890 [Thermoflexia bacterium]|nr:hypothetical protein [Thermoflexia bacterium]
MVALVPDLKLMHFIKPTVDTPFHIDYSWWDKHALDINIELLAHLCPTHREVYQQQQTGAEIDWIDWVTGEVQKVAGLQYVITTHCSQEPGYITHAATLVGTIFRVFLANGNTPLTPEQLAGKIEYPAGQILRVLAGRKVRKGLRPTR